MDFSRRHTSKYDAETYVALWSALCTGEVAAIEQLYDHHSGLVYGVSLKVLGNTSEAEDLTQDIFVELVEKKKYDPTRGTLRTYLLMLTRSRAIDRLRSRKTGQRSQQKLQTHHAAFEQVAPDLTTQNALEAERSETIKAALSQLSDTQKQALHLAYYEGLSQADIASRLNTPLGTIKARTRRGLLKLREILSPHQNESPETKHEKGERTR